MMSNDDEAILVLPQDGPIVYADRTELARSLAVRAIVTADTAEVRVQDASRPDGVAARILPLGNGTGTARLPSGVRPFQIIVVPVSPGPIVMTAFDAAGKQIGTVTIP